MNEDLKYEREIHSFGRSSNLIAVALMLFVPVATMLYFDVSLNVSATFLAALQLSLVFIPTNLIEVISFAPILGSGGTYLSFVTGNVMNMKVPAAKSGHIIAKVEPHSKEGEIISILAIGVSSLVTCFILFIGMILSAPLMPILSAPFLAPGFSNVMPALLGIMIIQAIIKTPKLAILPLILAFFAGVFVPNYGLYQGYVLISIMFISVLFAIFYSKKSKI